MDSLAHSEYPDCSGSPTGRHRDVIGVIGGRIPPGQELLLGGIQSLARPDDPSVPAYPESSKFQFTQRCVVHCDSEVKKKAFVKRSFNSVFRRLHFFVKILGVRQDSDNPFVATFFATLAFALRIRR